MGNHRLVTNGGGGHEAAGACQAPNADAERGPGELAARITGDG